MADAGFGSKAPLFLRTNDTYSIKCTLYGKTQVLFFFFPDYNQNTYLKIILKKLMQIKS